MRLKILNFTDFLQRICLILNWKRSTSKITNKEKLFSKYTSFQIIEIYSNLSSPTIKFVSCFNPLLIFFKTYLMLFTRFVYNRLYFSFGHWKFFRYKNSFCNTPTCIKLTDLNLFIKHIRLHLHKLFIYCHTTINYYSCYFLKFLIFDVIIKPICNRV
jgi:hypothetical protein